MLARSFHRTATLVFSLALALTLVFPALPVHANEAGDLASDIAQETTAAENAQDAVSELSDTPSEDELDAIAQALDSGAEATSYSFAGIDSTAANQLAFAQLQMQLAQQNRNQALGKIQVIQEQQKKSAALTDAITKLRELKEKIAAGATSTLPADLAKTLASAGVSVPDAESADGYTAEEIDTIITLANTAKAGISNNSQTAQQILEDYVSQYNNYMQSASSAIEHASDVLKGTAQRATVSAEASDGGFSMLALGVGAGAVAGAVAGALAAYVLVRKRLEADKTTASAERE